jgi:Mg-chelatase subunit ChlD
MSKLRPASERKAIAADLAKLEAGGGTTFVPALQLALDTLKPLKLARKHVLFLSDGEAPTEGLEELLRDIRAAGITVSAVGVAGADRNLLNLIADAGDGRVYFVEDLKMLPKLFAAEVERALR